MHPQDGRVSAIFVMQALSGQPITIYGDGQQTRSFCYVNDLIDGLMKLMASPADVTGPINLGNPHEVTIRELTDRVFAATGKRSEIVHRPLPENDPRQRLPDITRARRLLGWAPSTPLDEGLGRTTAYFRGLLDANAEPVRPAG